MEHFYPDQRWSSEAEPELGIGIVTETARGRVRIEFPFSGETRLYAAENAPLRRVLFKVGDTIEDRYGRRMVVEKVEQRDELIFYIGKDRRFSEAFLGNVTLKQGATERLLLGQVDTPYTFDLRRRTLQNDHFRRISPVNGLMGGRIDLIPHQLYIAHEVSSRYAPRVLLSDEVGLGKTIEACLILHRLLLSGRISRVLILVPESLVHQWFVEVLRRFNLWFHIFDEERCLSLEEGAPDGNPFLDDQLILCSTDFLASSPKRARQALAADWDMLVVDEAHHLEWTPEKASPEYLLVEMLGQVAHGMLLLTATPEQLGLESHFARLRLLDPERYADLEAFKNESRDHKATADLVEKLSSETALSKTEEELLKVHFGPERVKALAAGDPAARRNLIEDLLDQHGPGRVVFRNTRSSMKGFPVRKVHLVPLQVEKDHQSWVERLGREFELDLQPAGSPVENHQFRFGSDPRVGWVVELLKKLKSAKVLLICRSKEKVLALEKALRERGNLKAAVFHEDLTIVQRDRNAAWFAEPEGARILLCSEIGSEGRNFQFAHHLILFDLPLHPELLEQRIGRLDRIGQTRDIQIHVPWLEGSAQEVLVRWYHEGLNALAKNLEGGNEVSRLYRERVLEVARQADFQPNLEALISDTREFHQTLREKMAKGRDRLLEMNSFRPEAAANLVEQIRNADQDTGLESWLNDVFEHFSVEVDDMGPRTYLLNLPRKNTHTFPGIPDEGIMVTFDRSRALAREDIGFLSWDHPMITGALDTMLTSDTGNAAFGVLPQAGQGILLEVLFVLETGGRQHLNMDRFLPNTPVRVVVDHAGRDVTHDFPVEEMNQQIRGGQIDDLIDNEVLVETIIPNMIESATQIAKERGEELIEAGLQKMEQTLEHEISRLQRLQKVNKDIRPEEIRLAQNEQRELALRMREAAVRLDSLMLIRKGIL
ncbi:MAG: RNA polymerase-associated protein RapA [Bacteroidia bacterium]|nr:RNA polymerase-associated protein RapA [Bacteroidia bacterium]